MFCSPRSIRLASAISRRTTAALLLALAVAGSNACHPYRQPDEPYVEARFLVPLVDNRGVAFDPERFEWLEEQLARRFGGWTDEGVFNGAWLNGRHIVREKSRRYFVAVRPGDLARLRRFLNEVKNEFHQQTLYLSIVRGDVYFL